MATHDYVLDNQSGADFRSDLNNVLQAIVSNNSSTSEPSTTFAYQIWIDTTNSLAKIRNSTNNGWITLPFSISADNTVDINGGTVNGISSLSFTSGQTVTSILDEDNFSSNSNTALATQQSIKAYVDNQVTIQDLDISDGSNTIAIDLDSETLSLLGGTGVTSTASSNSVTFAIGQSVGTGDNVVFNQVTSALVGNASTATALQTARTINNTSFDGTANISFNTDKVSEGSSNLYYTDARFDTRLGTKDTGDLTEGSNLYYTDARFDTRLGTKDTDDLSEGSSNLYYTNARADARVNLQTGSNLDLSNKSTSDLSEGTNLYYTATRFNTAFSGKSTSDLSEGTNLYYTDARFDTRLGTKDTDNLSEGSSNLYYTDARSNSAIDARVTQSFVNALNVNAASVDDNSVALGSKTTGNYVQDITGTTNEVEVSGSGSESSSVTIGLPDNVVIAGNLTVNGTTVTVNTDTLSVEDPLIKLAKNNDSADSVDIGFYGLYDTSGSQDLYAGLFRDANDSGKFKLFKDLQAEPTTTVNTSGTGYSVATLVANLEGNVTGTVSSISNFSTSNLSEGTNLYYTDARFDTRLGTKDTGDLAEGSNLYYTNARADARVNLQTGSNLDLSNKSTSDLSEGTNLYYTDARFDTRLGTKDTDDLSEGSSNLYYTDTRANAAIDARVTNTFINNLSGVVADTTTALATARTIGGVSFDGTANIDLPGVNSAGNQNTSGNAATATALATGRNFSLTGNVTANAVSFDGTGNVALATTLADSTVTSAKLSGALTTPSDLTVGGAFTSQGIDDNADATSLIIDSSERIGLNGLTPSNYWTSADDLVLGGTGSGVNHGMTLVTADDASGSIYFADGTSGEDRYRGIISYNHSTNSFDFHTNASYALSITNGGDLGIGTTTVDPLSLSFSGTGLAINEDSGTAFMQIDSSNGSRIDFGISGSRNSTIYADANVFQISRGTAHPITFFTNGSERVRINSAGTLLIGKTADNLTDSGFTLKKRVGSDHAQLTCVGGGSTSVETYYVYDSSNSEFEFFVSYAGAVYYRSLVSLSDERKKDNIADITFGLDAIKELRPVSFDWKNNKGNDQLGFIAQEVETTSLKQLVSTYKDENIEDCKSLNKEQMIPVLVKAIQDQQVIIEDLKSRIETLEK